MIDETTEMLFSPFNRRVGNPARQQIHTKEQFEDFIREWNGKSHVYVDIYAKKGKGKIDKIYYDFDEDEHHTFEDVFEASKKFYLWLVKHKYTVIPIVSGWKGFHFYILLKPKKYEFAKKKLFNAQCYLLQETFGEIPSFVDTIVLGDIKQMARVPGTLHAPQHTTYCTYLPSDFEEMSLQETVKHMKSHHTYTYKIQSLPTLYDFPEVDIEYGERKEKEKIEWEDNLDISSEEGGILKQVCRPCIYKQITEVPEPSNNARLCAAIDLKELGFNRNEIFTLFKKLNWRDWNPSAKPGGTRYYINRIFKKDYDAWNCSTIRRKNLTTRDLCFKCVKNKFL